MFGSNIFYLLLNILLIILILIRNPNEQTLQENLRPLNMFETFGSAKRNLDTFIKILIFFYFLIGFIFSSKIFV
jgi:preprotein translocase subunit SecG